MPSSLFRFVFLLSLMYARITSRRPYSPKVNMKKMCISITTQASGGHGGKISSGATNAAGRRFGTAIVRVLLELRLQKHQGSS